VIFVGDDWAEDHHDLYLMDESGQRLATRRLPEGLAGIRALHELIAAHAAEPDQVVVGIETDRGSSVSALTAAGYRVWAINPMAAARYRDRHHLSARSPTPRMPSCWLIWCAPTDTTTDRSPVTAPRLSRSRCWLAPIRGVCCTNR